ncbi:MAG: DNRLRE domain-containing protein, partial [Anaerolineae bacterium]
MSYKRTLFTILMIAALGMAMSAATFTAAKEIADTPRNPAAPAQTTVTLNAVADATVREWAPDANFGDEGSLELSYGGPGEEAVTLVRFDLSGLPSDAIVDSASMRLYLEGAGGADPVTIAAYAVTSTWEETGEEGVTWNTFPTAAWIGINADIDGEEGSYKSWQATSFAQSWIDDPASNYGVMLRGPTEDYERWFESRDHMEMVPQLEVTYHLPPYTFTGHVYEGEPEDTSTLLEGVTVELWGDEDEWPESGAERVLLASDLPTGPDGAFLLEWDRASAWPYLHVIETDPADAISTGADADPPGSVTNDNVITYRYDDLLETGLHDFGGIAFWDRFPE